MTKAHDTQSRFRRRKSAPIFWTVCHTDRRRSDPTGADRLRILSVDFRRRFFVPDTAPIFGAGLGADRRRLSTPKSGLCVIGFKYGILVLKVSNRRTFLGLKAEVMISLFQISEFPTMSSSSFEFEFELARSFLILCGSKPSSCLINIKICIFA